MKETIAKRWSGSRPRDIKMLLDQPIDKIVTFIAKVFDCLINTKLNGEVIDDLVEDIALIVNILAPESEGGYEEIRTAIDNGLRLLIDVCLESAKVSLKDPAYIQREQAIWVARAFLLRVNH